MARVPSTILSIASLFFVLSLHPEVSNAHPASLHLAPTINSTFPPLNATNEVLPYCRYEPDWYTPTDVNLEVAHCQDAIQFLVDQEVAEYGSRIFRWSYPSNVDGPLTRANPRRYVLDDCVLSIWMRVLAEGVDEEIWTADPRPKGSPNKDNEDFQSIARQAYSIFDHCVLGSGKGPFSVGAAGWLPTGTGNGMVVALWGRGSRADDWLQAHMEQHLQLPVANQSNVATT